MTYLHLFYVFFKTGLFTIGGGLAALPLLKEEMVDGGWVTHQEFIDMIAVSQSTPGPIGINMATFVGYQTASVAGALIATTGMVAPSLIIIVIIAHFMKAYAENKYVESAMKSLRPAAVGLIAAATWFILQSAILTVPTHLFHLNYIALGLFIALGVLRWFWKTHPIVFIAIGGVAGIILF